MFSKKMVFFLIFYYIAPYLFKFVNYLVGGFSSNIVVLADIAHDAMGLILIIYMFIRIYQAKDQKADT